MKILLRKSIKGTLAGWFVAVLFTMAGCAHWQPEGQHPASLMNTPSLSGGEIRHFWDSIRFSREDADYFYRLGRHFQRRGKHRIAVKEFLRVIERDPLRADAHNAMGVSYDQLSEFDLAEQHYRWALVLNPDFAAAHNNLGYSYLIQGKPRQAIDPLLEAVSLQGDNVLFHNNLGLAYEQTGQTDKAVVEFQHAGKGRQARVLEKWNPQVLSVPVETAQTTPLFDQSGENVTPFVLNSKHESKEGPVTGVNGQAPVWVAPRIEIANGNGLSKMARNISLLFQENGYLVHRRSNADNFHHQRTRILFSDSQRQVAGNLAQILFGPGISCDLIYDGGNDNQIKVLIGKDIAPLNQLFSGRLSIQVANGNGVQGMAQKLTDTFKSKGFHTVHPVNADHFAYAFTQILYPSDELSNAQFIARQFAGNCSGRLVRNDRIGNAIRIILGQDFKI
jgi:Flp pilus assembly protein TadD